MASHGDVGLRAQARKDLRKYDNPENGKNKLFLNPAYLESIIKKYNKLNDAELRQWANSVKHRRG